MGMHDAHPVLDTIVIRVRSARAAHRALATAGRTAREQTLLGSGREVTIVVRVSHSLQVDAHPGMLDKDMRLFNQDWLDCL
jgi:hypothetical protein